MARKSKTPPAPPTPPATASQPMRIAQAAQLLGVSTTTLYNDAKANAAGITIRDGSYHVDFARYNAWRMALGRTETAVSAMGAETGPSLSPAGRPAAAGSEIPSIGGKTVGMVRLEREILELERDKLAHQKEVGSLVESGEVRQAWVRGLTELANALDEAPYRAVDDVRDALKLTAPQGAELARAIQRAIRVTLDRCVVEKQPRPSTPPFDPRGFWIPSGSSVRWPAASSNSRARSRRTSGQSGTRNT